MFFFVRSRENMELFRRMKHSNIAFFALVLVGFVDYYRTFFFQKWEMNILLMFLSNLCLVIFLYYWMRAIQELLAYENTGKWFRVIKIEGAAFLIAWLLVYVFFMDKEYNVFSLQGRLLAMVPDALFYLTLIAFNIYCIFIAMKNMEDKQKRNYFLSVNAMILIYYCWGFSNDIALVFYPFGEGIYDLYPLNPVILIYLLSNIWTILYLYKNNDINGVNENEREGAGADFLPVACSLDEIAERFKLTKREKELVQLVYQGHTNPEISELLNISTGTVKRHTQNIYRKMEVKNRFELIYLIKTE